MKILLLGEYSGFFNSLKSGLKALNQDVLLAGRKDSFKNYPVDISLEPHYFTKKYLNLLRQLIFRLFDFDMANLEVFYNFFKHKESFKKFDIVMLINEQPLTQVPFLEKKILKFIFRQNKRVFLAACGDDYVYIQFLLNTGIKYHLLDPYLKDHKLKSYYKHSLHYNKSISKDVHNYVFENIQAVIPTDFDYVMAYKNHTKATKLIPYPIQLHLLDYQKPLISNKVIIFHGINKTNFYKKGNNHFNEALNIIQNKYPHKIEIITAVSLPYQEYIKRYNSCHIVLDQVYAYDQGYNALEAMAKGKVVFTGAEQEWLDFYNLEEDTVAINALPDVDYLVRKLEWLILNPSKIESISKNARLFIEQHHNYIQVAKQYLNTWHTATN